MKKYLASKFLNIVEGTDLLRRFKISIISIYKVFSNKFSSKPAIFTGFIRH